MKKLLLSLVALLAFASANLSAHRHHHARYYTNDACCDNGYGRNFLATTGDFVVGTVYGAANVASSVVYTFTPIGWWGNNNNCCAERTTCCNAERTTCCK